jgi:hypothetical protein
METDKIRKLSEFEKFEKNPFVEKAIQEVQISRRYRSDTSTDKKAILQAINPDTGEVLGHTMFVRQVEVDEEKFAKVYLSQFQSFWDLNKAAIRVFGYIMSKMIPKHDRVEFRLSECMEHTKYSTKKPVYEGLTALINAEIIARGYNEHIYFINPLVTFNGDRVSYVKTYIKRRKETTDINQLGLFSNRGHFVENFEAEKQN